MTKELETSLQKYLELRRRYPEILQIVIDICVINFSSTRKGGKIANRKIIREYEYWSKFPICRVIGAMIVYNLKKPYLKGCDERYLRGIIRNINDYEIKKLRLFSSEELEKIFKKDKEIIITRCQECKGEGYIFKSGDELKPVECKCLKEFNKRRLQILRENINWVNDLGEI
jgi:hypothetical protein